MSSLIPPFYWMIDFLWFLEAWSHVKSILNQQWWLWNQIDNLFKFKQLFPSDNCFVFVWLKQPLENCLKQVNFRYQIQIIVNTPYAQSLLHVLFVCNNAKHSWFFYKMKFFSDTLLSVLLTALLWNEVTRCVVSFHCGV